MPAGKNDDSVAADLAPDRALAGNYDELCKVAMLGACAGLSIVSEGEL